MTPRRQRPATPAPPPAPAPSRLTPRSIVILYAALGAAWIVFSDRLLSLVVPDAPQRDRLQSVKGAIFIAATALLLYGLMRRMSQERRFADEQVRTVLDAMSDAVLVLDRAGIVVDGNRAACALWGVRDVRALRMPIAEFLERFHVRHPDGRPFTSVEAVSLRALQGDPATVELRARRGDGAELVVSASSSPVRALPGEPPLLAVTVLRDITEMKRFEEMRDEFLATAAHEFKTPLAIVKAYAQLMRRRREGDAAALDVIGRQIDRLTRMVQQLLEVSRLRLGGGELRRERFDLAALVAEVADSMRAGLEDRHILVEPAAPAAVFGDRERIAQVVANLLENAVRFSPEGGDVEAVLLRRSDEVVVSVRDHGVGIPIDRQGRVFERFYRAHAGTTGDFGGFGVGLDVSREIVARHGGKIWFESAPGTGSTFSFSLPAAPEELS